MQTFFRSTNSLKAHLASFCAVMLWASSFVIIREAVTYLTPGVVALLRYSIASIFMLILFLHPSVKHRVNWKQIPWLLLIGFIGIGIYNICLNISEVSLTAGSTSFIVGQIPIISSILAIIFLGENINRITWIAYIICSFGVMLIAIGESGGLTFNIGIIYALIAALTGSIYTILQKPLLKIISPLELMAYVIWGGTLLLLYYTPELYHEWPRLHPHILMAIAFMGIFPAAIAYTLWSYSIAHLKVSIASFYVYYMPIVTILMAWCYLHELPHLISLIGCILALIGTLIAHRSIR